MKQVCILCGRKEEMPKEAIEAIERLLNMKLDPEGIIEGICPQCANRALCHN